MPRSRFLQLVSREVKRAGHLHPPFTTRHEALGVIWEEFEELKTLIFTKRPCASQMVKEAVHVAAMCQRFVQDLKLLELLE